MAEHRPSPLLNLSRLKTAAATTRNGAGAPASLRASGGETLTTSSSIFDARVELAADLQRREARRAQARAEAADTEGEASVLAALRAVHRLLREAGEIERRRRNGGIEEKKRDSILLRTCRREQSGIPGALLEPFRQFLFAIAPPSKREASCLSPSELPKLNYSERLPTGSSLN